MCRTDKDHKKLPKFSIRQKRQEFLPFLFENGLIVLEAAESVAVAAAAKKKNDDPDTVTSVTTSLASAPEATAITAAA